MRTVDQTELLEVLHLVAKSRTLAEAAAVTGLSRSAISRRIAKLESLVGERLFERTNECLRPTENGRDFIVRSEEWMQRFKELSTPAGENAQEVTSIQISAPSAIGNGLLIPWLTIFQEMHPEVLFDLTLSLGPVRLLPPGCDIRISHGLFPCERVLIRPLGNMLRMMVANADYLMRHGMPKRPEELINHSLLGGNDLLDGSPLIVTRGAERVAVPYYPRLRLHDHGAARTAALNGIGIAVHAFVYDTIDFVKRGQLIEVLPQWEPEPTPVTLLLPLSQPLRPIVSELAEFLEMKWRSHPYLSSPDL